jgi:serine protease inhibitor
MHAGIGKEKRCHVSVATRFFYLIRNQQSGAILFSGHIDELTPVQ